MRKIHILYRYFWVLCTLLSLALPAPGQHFLFSDTSRGLGNLNVLSLTQDRDGYLWVGTESGLYRYDGFRYQNFENEEGIAGHRIPWMVSAANGSLVVLSDAGLYFRNANGYFQPLLAETSELRPTEVTAMTITPGSILYLASGGSLYRLQPRGNAYSAPQKIGTDSPVHTVFADSRGRVWMDCGSDLCHLDSKDHAVHSATALQLPRDHWKSIAEDPAGNLWLLGNSHLVEITTRQTLRQIPWIAKEHSNSSPTRLNFSADNQPMLAIRNQIHIYRDGRWKTVWQENGIDHAAISALFRDHHGTLWIAQTGRGLKRWIGEGIWELFSTHEGLGSDVVMTTLRDREKGLWVSTQGGLFWFPPNAERPWIWEQPKDRRLPLETLLEASDGSVWAGSSAGALMRIQPKTFRGSYWQLPAVRRIATDATGTLHIATAAGLYHADPSGQQPPVADMLPESHNTRQSFTDLAQQPHGALWAVGSGGLYRLDGSHWRSIHPGLNKFSIRRIAFDLKGNLWAAGDFQGLLRMHVQQETIAETEHIAEAPLLSTHISTLQTDTQGRLWIGQDRGLSVYDGNSWHNYSRNNGLPWNDCPENGLSFDRDGSLWISTSAGLVHLLRTTPLPLTDRSSIALMDASLGSQHFQSGAELRWDDQPLRFTFAALDFSHPHPAWLRYRLLGQEKNWNRSSDGIAHYAQLPPGEYLLEVIGEDESGDDASPALDIHFRILPLWWRNPHVVVPLGALLLAFLLFVCLRFTAFSRYGQLRHSTAQTLQRLEKLEKEEAALVANRRQHRNQADYDTLTGLWTRRFLLERLHGEMERSRRHQFCVSVLRLDLDGMQHLNESQGHQMGDRVLQEVSRILLRAVRSYDWVGRYEEDEFLIILPGSNLSTAQARAEAMLQMIAAANLPGRNATIPLSACIGVASGEQRNSEELLEAAKEALRCAQREGRNRIALNHGPARPCKKTPYDAPDSLFHTHE